jgi:sugar lactone lactonase YvrE
LIVGESFGARLTAFDIARDGRSRTARVRRARAARDPDGIALDAEGAVWVASPTTGECPARTRAARVGAGARLGAGLRVRAGGPDRKTLFICTASTHHPVECVEKRGGKIETVNVDVPGAGWP